MLDRDRLWDEVHMPLTVRADLLMLETAGRPKRHEHELGVLGFFRRDNNEPQLGAPNNNNTYAHVHISLQTMSTSSPCAEQAQP